MAAHGSRERTLVTEDGSVVCARCRIAKDPWSRMRGLLGRRHLAEGEGILLRPASSVHTWFMLFPIDVVFLDRDLSVLRVVPRLRPWRAVWRHGAAVVLELAAGECDARGVGVGDRLDWLAA
ncbi:MAG: DUF192 domain-containing protein [Gaiellaceae bacterium]